MKQGLLLLISLLFILGCNGRSMDLSALDPSKEKPQPVLVTYMNDVGPIFENSCKLCHGENSPNGDWLNYEVAFEKQDRIYERVVTLKNMPIGIEISQEERDIIGLWIEQGALYE